MGCGASKLEAAVVNHVIKMTKAKSAQEEVKNSNEDPSRDFDFDEDIVDALIELSVIFFDPKVDSKENLKYKECLERQFMEVITLKESDEASVNKAIERAKMPIVFISCGSGYNNVKAIVEGSTIVLAIFIFCNDSQEYKDFKKCKKVIDIIDDFKDLPYLIKDVSAAMQYFRRFLETREERTFYDLSDRENIIRSLTVACKGDKFSVFYPLGTKRVKFEEYLTEKVTNDILMLAKGDKEVKARKKKIFNVLDYISKNPTPKGIIKSYTMDGLYFMLNLYLRYGNSQGFGLFKEYMFCLKACICQMGTPINKVGTKLYRGLSLRDEFLKRYTEKKGQILLLNAFTSTTLAKEKAIEFAFKSTGGKFVILEITTVAFDQAFTQFITDFGFPEENGVFFPADISAFSAYPAEKEVLFPPFYPIRIKGVTTQKHKKSDYELIEIESPYSVCIAGKDFALNIFKGEIEDTNWNEDYVESLFELTKKGVVDKLSLVKLGIKENAKIQQYIEKELTSGYEISKILIEREDLRGLHSLLSAVMTTKGLKYLSLQTNSINDEAAKYIGEGLATNTTLIELNLLSNLIGADGAAEIAKGLKLNKSLTSLILAKNKLEDKGAINLSEGLKEHKMLENLDLMGTHIGEEGIKYIAETLKEKSSLSTLNLGDIWLGRKGAIALFGALSTNNRIRSLNISNNGLGLTEAPFIADYLEFNKSLYELNIAGNTLSTQGLLTIFEKITPDSSLRILNINSNLVEDERSPDIAQAIKQKLSKLEELYMDGVGSKGSFWQNIFKAIKTDTKIRKCSPVWLNDVLRASRNDPTLIELNLKNLFIEKEFVLSLSEIFKVNTVVTKLDLHYNYYFETEATKRLVEGIKANKALSNLSLHWNKIQTEGGRAISELLKVNSTLKTLNLCGGEIGDEGASCIAESLKVNKTLMELDLGVNHFTEEGVRHISNALKVNSTLKILNFSHLNEFGDKGAIYIAQILKDSKTLTELELTATKIKFDGAKEIAEALKVNKVLTKLNMSLNDIGTEGAICIIRNIGADSVLADLNFAEISIKGDFTKLAEAIKNNTVITKLSLHGNAISAEMAQQLGIVLKENKKLEEFDLSKNIIGDEGVHHIIENAKSNTILTKIAFNNSESTGHKITDSGAIYISELLRLPTLKLAIVNLCGNEIQDKGAIAIFDALRTNRTLIELDLSKNRIGDKCLESLIGMLKVNKILSTFKLISNDIEEDSTKEICKVVKLYGIIKSFDLETEIPEKVVQIVQDIKNNKSLSYLALASAKLEKRDLKYITEALKVNSTISTAMFGNNDLGDQGAIIIAQYLKVNKVLTCLMLDSNKIGDIGVTALFEAMTMNQILMMLNLTDNNIGDQGAKAISKWLMIATTYSSLNLDKNHIGNEGAYALAEGLSVNANLSVLSLSENMIGDEGEKAIRKAVSKRVYFQCNFANQRKAH